MIEYKDIPKYCDLVDKNKRSTVILSKFQAQIFRRMMPNELAPLRRTAYFFDMAIYAGLIVYVLVCARNLLYLSSFRRHNDSLKDSIEFRDIHNGKVAVTFNPNAEENTFGHNQG